MAAVPDTRGIVVLGVGNILCGDDGFGVLAAGLLYSHYEFRPAIEILDGGTLGQTLYGRVTGASRLLLLDCVDAGLAPGSIVRKAGCELPQWLGAGRLSAHQGSLAEILAQAELRGESPDEIVLLGVQPACTEFGADMGDPAKRALGPVTGLALEVLARWGATWVRSRRPGRFLPRGLESFAQAGGVFRQQPWAGRTP